MNLFSLFSSNKLKKLLQQGATIVDTRTVYEYDKGRIKDSVNIPLDRFMANIERIRQLPKPIVFCGTTESESNKAVGLAKNNGISGVHNGGNWEKLLQIKGEL